MHLPDDFDPPVGFVETIAPGIRRVVAPNPSPMTYRGTNTYLVGTRDLAVIDPGPGTKDHLEAILDACTTQQKITHVLVTHSHLDHSPLARLLADETSAQVFGFGGPEAGRSRVMQEFAKSGLVGGGEGIDVKFNPDQGLVDGDVVSGSDWALEVIHTPGHLGNHICLALGNTCFTGDHVMGWASSLISPPDGDLTDYMKSCTRLQERSWTAFYPGHGALIEAPNKRLAWLVAHRQERETAILDSLASGPASAGDLAREIYIDLNPALLPAATRTVLAHLIDLMQNAHVAPTHALQANVPFRRLKPT